MGDAAQDIPQGIAQAIQGGAQSAEDAVGGLGPLALVVFLLIMVGGRKGR